jgi:uncharacterized protein (DUF302 family)
LRQAGFHLFTTINHSAVAPPDAQMPHTVNLYFGMPAQGTPVMMRFPELATLLPLCVSVQQMNITATPNTTHRSATRRRRVRTRTRARTSTSTHKKAITARLTFVNPFVGVDGDRLGVPKINREWMKRLSRAAEAMDNAVGNALFGGKVRG